MNASKRESQQLRSSRQRFSSNLKKYQMANETDYKNLINDIIAKQTLILGPDIVLLKARNVPGLKLSDDGKAEAIEGDPQEVLQKLINEYISLSGQIVKNILTPVFAKYPDIKLEIKN